MKRERMRLRHCAGSPAGGVLMRNAGQPSLERDSPFYQIARKVPNFVVNFQITCRAKFPQIFCISCLRGESFAQEIDIPDDEIVAVVMGSLSYPDVSVCLDGWGAFDLDGYRPWACSQTDCTEIRKAFWDQGHD